MVGTACAVQSRGDALRRGFAGLVYVSFSPDSLPSPEATTVHDLLGSLVGHFSASVRRYKYMHLFYVDRDLLHSCKREHRVFLSPAFKFSQPRIWQPFAGTFRLVSFFTPQTVLRRTSRAFGSARALDRLQTKILDVALLNGGRVFIFSGC